MASLHVRVELSDRRDVAVLLIQQVNLRLNSLHVLGLCGALLIVDIEAIDLLRSSDRLLQQRTQYRRRSI